MDKIPFPQADDFQKIVRILAINNEEYLKDFEFMSGYLDGISTRQVSYYLSAAMYIGILDKEKHFTEIGHKIRQLDNYSRIVELIRILLSDEIIGKVYISQKVLDVTYALDDIGEVIREYYPDYTEPLYKRRAQTVACWMYWINTYLNK